MRLTLAFLVAFLAFPSLVLAEGNGVTRRDGFLRIWQTIQRPAYETRDTFDDLPEGTTGALEINYARSRGLLDDDSDSFFPDQPMTLADAVIWLMRTRNVDDVDQMERADIPELLSRYPIVDDNANISSSVSEEELTTLMQKFDTMLREEVHEFSLYAEKFHGKGTAFGETFDMNAFTAAHRTFPYNTLVRVTNVDNDKSVVVRINDRGPFVEGRDMDLSLASFLAIEDRSKGVGHARFERLGDAELVDACHPTEERRYQQRITRDVRFRRGIPHSLSVGEQLHLFANKPFVVRRITYPDGTSVRIQDFVLEDEGYAFTPVQEGQYAFWVGTIDGRSREMRMTVSQCTDDQ